MNDLESRLTTAMRDEAEEFSMNVDLKESVLELDRRLDRTDRARRTRTWFVAVAAAAAVALVAAILWPTLHRQEPPADPASGPTPTYTSAFFTDPFTTELPAWTADGTTRKVYQSSQYQYWDHCGSDATCVNLSVTYVAGILSGSSTTPVDARGLTAHLTSLGTSGKVRIVSTTPTTVDGHPATDMRVETNDELTSQLACGPTSCQDVNAHSLARWVVVDMGPTAAPVLIWTAAPTVNPQASEWVGQLDVVLRTLRFTGAGPLEGTWTATLTAEQAGAAMTAAGLPTSSVQRYGDPVRLKAVFSSGFVLVSVVGKDGSLLAPVANVGYKEASGELTLADGQRLRVSGVPASTRFVPEGVPSSTPGTATRTAIALLVAGSWSH